MGAHELSLTQIEAEVRRFLSSDAPEVLCIKGKWGVGKTYGWKKFLNDAVQNSTLALMRYSYVSLFGLNSLDDLRFTIFENTVTGDKIGSGPDAGTIHDLLTKSNERARKAKLGIELLSAFFNRKGAADVLFKSAFIMVRDQLVCLDDLERAGTGLNARDVLGLASLLKEQRNCKVVLLLNDTEYDQKDEFDRQLEKVADVTLTFDLTASEAVTIALRGDDKAAALLKPRIVELGITNIRVIKKIERLAIRLVGLLAKYDDAIVQQAVATLALASWSMQQPTLAPPHSFLRSYNRTNIATRYDHEKTDENTVKWRRIIQDYPFSSPNQLDLLIMEGAASGYFNDNILLSTANLIQEQQHCKTPDAAFTRAWNELYHGSLTTSDDDFLDALHMSAIDEAKAITPLNINGAIRMLREFGRADQADEVIANYILANNEKGPEFFSIKNHHFSSDDRLDDGLRDAFAKRRAQHIDKRTPLDVLRSMGSRQNWSEADVMLMAKQSANDLEQMFEALKGNDLRQSIDIILILGGSGLEGSDAIKENSTEALRRIAAKSPLRARKIRRYGVPL